MLKKIKQRLRREAYFPSWLGMVISPVFIVRSCLLKAIKKFSPLVCGDVLDLGCGIKPYESLFIKATSYTGVDILVSGHDHTDSKIDVYYDGKVLPFTNECFDSVVSFEVFEHVFNIEEVLAEVLRVLKSDGLFLISIPFAWEEHEVPYDFARYTSFGIEHVLHKAGFQVVHICKSSTAFLAIAQLFIAYFYKYVSPHSRISSIIFQVLIIFPLNIASLLINAVIPKHYDYFCNCIVLCKKNL
jgi:SAM-dependent methyltransferase